MFCNFKYSYLLKFLLILILITTIYNTIENLVVVRKYGSTKLNNVYEDFWIGKNMLYSSQEKEYRYCFKETTNFNDTTITWKVHPKPCNSQISVILLIKSSIVRNSLRQSVRKTWGQQVKDDSIGSIQRIFLVASSANSTVTLLEKENEIHNDILQGTFEDTFRSVSRKVFMGFQFVKMHCSNAKLIIVVDDDAIILPWNLFPNVNIAVKQENIQYLAGFIWRGMMIVRENNSLYYTPYSEYNCSIYPPYPSGTVYVVSYNVMVSLYYLSKTVQYMYTDDSVMGVFAKIANITLTEFSFDRVSFSPEELFSTHNQRDFSKLIAVHGVDHAKDQIRMWAEFCYTKSSDEEAARLIYLYCSSLL